MSGKNLGACNCQPHFNGLTPAQAERLAMLAEECGEVIQVIGKILRHGYENFHPLKPGVPNSELLRRELDDVGAVVSMMIDSGELLQQEFEELLGARARKLRYAHHQDNEGGAA